MLALAIGANTAIYSVTKAVVFTPLPFPKPDRLVHIFEGSAGERYQPGGENILSSVRPRLIPGLAQECHLFRQPFSSPKHAVDPAGRRWRLSR
jgi:hypothetical protein